MSVEFPTPSPMISGIASASAALDGERVRPANVVFVAVLGALVARRHTHVVHEEVVRARLAGLACDEPLAHLSRREVLHRRSACPWHVGVHARSQGIVQPPQPFRSEELRLVVLHNVCIEVAHRVVGAEPWPCVLRQVALVPALLTHAEHDHTLLACPV